MDSNERREIVLDYLSACDPTEFEQVVRESRGVTKAQAAAALRRFIRGSSTQEEQ